MAISDDERRAVARWAAGSAARALPLFEAIAVHDTRARDAIEIARAFADGGRRSRELTRIALAAHRAGREIDNAVGLAAARSASLAAATANIHGETTIGTLGHILGPAAYAALAHELATGDRAAAENELAWAVDQATPSIRALVRRVPPSGGGRRRLGELQADLESMLRG